jgi:putative ABC transport system permease protein
MTIFTIIKKANNNLFRTKLRTFLTILSVFIGSLTLSLILMANIGFQNWINNQMSGVSDKGQMQVTATGGDSVVVFNPSIIAEYKEGLEDGVIYQYLKNEDVDNLKKIKNVEEVKTPQYSALKLLYTEYQDSKKIYSRIYPIYSSTELALYTGQMPKYTDTNKIVLSFEVAQKMGYNEPKDLVNKEVEMVFKNSDDQKFTEKFVVTGITKNNIMYNNVNHLPEKIIDNLIKKTYTEKELQTFSSYANLDILYSKNLSQTEVETLKQDIKKANYGVVTNQSQADQLKGIIQATQLVLSLFSVIALITAFFGVINTLITSTLERTKEIGLMRALGMSKNGIFSLFAVEAVLIGFWGSFLGVFTTYLISLVVNNITASQKVFGFENGDVLIVSPVNALIVMGIISFLTLIAGIIPAIKASKMDVINALKYE